MIAEPLAKFENLKDRHSERSEESQRFQLVTGPEILRFAQNDISLMPYLNKSPIFARGSADSYIFSCCRLSTVYCPLSIDGVMQGFQISFIINLNAGFDGD